MSSKSGDEGRASASSVDRNAANRMDPYECSVVMPHRSGVSDPSRNATLRFPDFRRAPQSGVSSHAYSSGKGGQESWRRTPKNRTMVPALMVRKAPLSSRMSFFAPFHRSATCWVWG